MVIKKKTNKNLKIFSNKLNKKEYYLEKKVKIK